MPIDPHDVRRILTEAERPVGLKELLRLGGYHPGQQTDMKRALRDLLRRGEVAKDGKRFQLPRAQRRAQAPGTAERARQGPAPRGASEEGGLTGRGRRTEAPSRGFPPRGGHEPHAPWERRGAATEAGGHRGAPTGGRGRGARGFEAAGPRGGRPGRELQAGPARGGAQGAQRGGRRLEPRMASGGLASGGTASGGRASGGRPGGPAGRRAPELPAPRRGVKRGGPPPREVGRGGRRTRGWERYEAEAWEAPSGRGTPPAAGGEVVEGVLHLHRDGYGFVHPLSGKGENIFLPAFEAQRALDKDVVRVAVRGPEGRREGRLLEVRERRRQLVVGTYRHRGRRSHVEPQDPRLGDIQVPPTQLARDGDVVKVRLGVGTGLVDETGLHGEVAGSLGRPGHPSAEVLSLVFAQGFSDEFPPEVMDEADAVPLTLPESEARGEGRRDLRDLPLVTIDSEDARDFDDAVFAEPHARGWRLVVAIADVTHYVREGQPLDDEALKRATSVYLPDRVLPMLPERLSNGICSLRPDEDRLCMVADIVLNKQGQRVSTDLYPAVMRSAARCTYNEVQAVLDGHNVPHRNAFKEHFERLATVARCLRKMREKRGAIDFDLPESRVVMGDEGYPERVVKRERLFAHRLIEECMLAANEAVATFFQERGLPSVYRFHGEPDEEKLRAFMTLAAAHGLTFGGGEEGAPTSAELNTFVQSLQGHPEQRTLNQLLLRSMMQAVYSSENVGHYGLAAEHYLHFTSPIRRYPDLLVHRLLKAHWARKGRKRTDAHLEVETDRLEAMAAHCSERERAAMQSERDVSAFLVCVLMRDRVGEEFPATVTSVADFGFFVELEEENVEGVVRAESVGAGAHVDPVLHALVFPDGRRVRVGDRVRVLLTSINWDRRQLELQAVAFEARPGAKAAGPVVRRRKAVEAAEAPAAAPGVKRRRARPEEAAPAAAKKAPARRRAAAPPEEPEEVAAREEAEEEEPVVPAYTPSRQVMRKAAPTRKAATRAAAQAPAAVREVEAPAAARRAARRKAADAEAPTRAPAAAESPATGRRTRRLDPDADVHVSPAEAERVRSEAETPETYGARPAFVIPGMEVEEVLPPTRSPHPGFDRLRTLAGQAGPARERPERPRGGGKPGPKARRR